MPYDIAPLADRSALHRAVRAHFDAAGFQEVETPYLASFPIPESTIELFRTDRRRPDGTASSLYLLPSPELWMKRLLAEGAPSLYQIGRCFRNGEQIDRWHRLEFTMLEWYALGASAEDNIGETQRLLSACARAVRSDPPTSITGAIRRYTMDEAFREFAGFSLEADLRDAGMADIAPYEGEYPAVLDRARAALGGRLREKALPGGEEAAEDADDLFHRLFLTLVEDALPTDRPLVLTHWPALVPTLARRIAGTPWSERWELYIRGVEVANCYGEETDRDALMAYWAAESARKETVDGPAESDSAWVRLISDGMPVCSGVAVGLDRLLALIREDGGLEGLDLFPIHDMIRR